MKELKFVSPVFFCFTKEIKVNLPESWAEMNERQFLMAVKIQHEEIDDITLVSGFFGVSKRMLSKITDFELYTLINQIEFLINPKATINYFIIGRLPKTKLFAPAGKLRNITMKRFILFDTLFFDYLSNKQDKDLIKMVAMLYMKESEDSQDIDISKRIAYLEKNVDKVSLNAILLNYIFIRKWLSKAFPHVFSFIEDDQTKEQKVKRPSGPSKPNRPDWRGIVDDFANSDITNLDKYYRMKATDFFRIMNRRISNYHKNVLRK